MPLGKWLTNILSMGRKCDYNFCCSPMTFTGFVLSNSNSIILPAIETSWNESSVHFATIWTLQLILVHSSWACDAKSSVSSFVVVEPRKASEPSPLKRMRNYLGFTTLSLRKSEVTRLVCFVAELFHDLCVKVTWSSWNDENLHTYMLKVRDEGVKIFITARHQLTI